MTHDHDPAVEVELVAREVVDSAYKLHTRLGPGLLEAVYESILARDLERRGLRVERQKTIAFDFEGMRFDRGLTIDLFVERSLVVELKSTEKPMPVHAKQVLTYLRLLNLPLGLLVNFGAPTLKEGLRRVVNDHKARVPMLRIHRSGP